MVEALESEVYSDPNAYTDKRENADEQIKDASTDYDEVFYDDVKRIPRLNLSVSLPTQRSTVVYCARVSNPNNQEN